MQTTKSILTWLHLSDIHHGHGDAAHQSDQRLVLQALRQDLRSIVGSGVPKPNVMLITGDLAFSGNVRRGDELKSVRLWIESVSNELKIDAERIFVIPGNHDLQRNVGEELAALRDLKAKLRSGSERIDNALSDPSARLLVTRQFSNYLSFAKHFGPRLPRRQAVVADLFWVYLLRLRKRLSVRLVGLNTALLCAKEEDEYGDLKRLQLGKEQLVRAFTSPEVDRDTEIVVVMSHHPPEWLRDRVDVEAAVNTYAHVHLYGHIHNAATERRRSGSGTDMIEVVAGAAHDEVAPSGTIPRHGYNVASIRSGHGDRLVLRVWPRVWSKAHDFRVDRDSLPKHDRQGRPYKADYVDHTLRFVLRKRRESRHRLRLSLKKQVVVRIIDWFDVDRIALSKDLYGLARGDALPSELSVLLRSPQYEQLASRLRVQARKQPDNRIVADQLQALHVAAARLRETTDVCARLLVNVSKHFGIRAAVSACARLLRHKLAKIVDSVARYQIDDGTAVVPDFLGRFDLREPAMLAQLTYGPRVLVRVHLCQETFIPTSPFLEIKEEAEFTSLYLPVERLQNTGSKLLTCLFDNAANIPADVWTDYVIPQLASAELPGTPGFPEWTAGAYVYVTEGELWDGQGGIEYSPERIGDKVVVVPQEWRVDPSGSASLPATRE